jgi:hypothetical protein
MKLVITLLKKDIPPTIKITVGNFVVDAKPLRLLIILVHDTDWY